MNINRLLTIKNIINKYNSCSQILLLFLTRLLFIEKLSINWKFLIIAGLVLELFLASLLHYAESKYIGYCLKHDTLLLYAIIIEILSIISHT